MPDLRVDRAAPQSTGLPGCVAKPPPGRYRCRRPTLRRTRLSVAFAAFAATVTVLTSCASGDVNPSRSPTRTSSRPNPPTQVHTETKTQTRTESHVAIQTRTAIETQTRTAIQTAAAPQTAASTPQPTQAAEPTSSSDSSAPAWLWWLAGAVVLAAVVTVVVLLRKRSRARAWATRFEATKGEVAWFARQLIPQLERAPTAQQMAGGWRIEADRIVSVEDRLTTLEATTADDVGRGRARTLRDAVRVSRTRLAGLDHTVDTVAATNLLQSAAAELETALSTVDPAAHVAAGGPPLR